LKTHYHTSFQDTTLSRVSVTPTSQIHASALLLLMTVGN